MSSLPSKGPYSPWSVGRRTLVARTCIKCGRLADGDSFPLLNHGRSRRRVCHDCHNARKKQDRERGIGVPNNRPPKDTRHSEYQHWSAEDDQRMRSLIESGTPYEVIALALGRSLRAVYKRRTVLGISRVRYSHRVEQPWKVERESYPPYPEDGWPVTVREP